MRYGSVCSGIEAATMAWHPLGWKPSFFSEIEKFPSAVLAHHYPHVPNLGDMTKFQEWPDHAIDLLVGGTPCQSFSVAGLRAGLADPRGNLMLTYLAIAARYRPRWLVWENVPGVLSSTGGRDFGALLTGLGQLGYGFAYRVLDAQYVRVDGFEQAVPQRRRRVFVVGYLGDWRRAAAVFFDAASLRGNPAPRRGTGEGSPASVARSVALRGREGGGTAELGGDIGMTLRASAGGGDKPHVMVSSLAAFNPQAGGKQTSLGYDPDAGVAGTLEANQTPAIAWSIMPQNSGKDYKARQVDVAQPLMAGGPVGGNQGGDFIQQPVAIHENQRSEITLNDTAGALGVGGGKPGQGDPAAFIGTAVRRLTPLECERLQGFPDGYTAIPRTKGKIAADGPRYKALGNSMAINSMRWIGERIAMVDAIHAEREAAA